MTISLYPCPYCGQRPVVKRVLGAEFVKWRAECWCAMAVGKSEEDLERRWNDLYCANDPADGRDCE